MSLLPGHQAFERLVLRMEPGSHLLRVWPLSGGISAQMAAIEVERSDGETRKMVVRRPNLTVIQQNPRAAFEEYTVLQVMHAHHIPVPSPIWLDESGEIFGMPSLVIQWIDGQVDFSPSDQHDYVEQMAAQLARIHTVNHLLPQLSFLMEKEPACAELTGQPVVDPRFQSDRIREKLLASPRLARRNQPVLLHGDYWPGNVLWHTSQLAAIIDWEDAALGDPLIDLAISRLDIACIFGPEAMRVFTGAYRSINPVDETDLPYWDGCAALRLARLVGSDIAGWAAFFHPYGRNDMTETSLLERYHGYIRQALKI